MNIKDTARLGALALGLSVAGGGCGIDALFFDKVTAGDHTIVPGAGNNFLEGSSSVPGSLAVYTATGTELTDLAGATTGDGGFEVTLPASSSFDNLLIEVSSASQNVWGIAPGVAAKESVLDADARINMGANVDAMGELGLDSTFVTLVILGQSRYGLPPVQLASLNPAAISEAAADLLALRGEEDERVIPLWEMMERLYADGATIAPALEPFPEEGESYLNLAALAPGLDLDGDDVPDTSTAAFEEALKLAVEALAFDICLSEDTIRVVFMVDFHEGNLDRNCNELDLWKWTDDAPGKQMFFVGGLHETSPTCGNDPEPCLTQQQFDDASQLMGNWVPNQVPMYDDGTNGDLVAGDNIWTITFDVPWFDAGSPTAKWTRIHYKYTWATPGALWTGSEEWPGNSRFLELQDQNGDGIITRYDNYGDETTNKGAANLLTPKNGGCGVVKWQSEIEDPETKCANDTLENMIDTDGDCVLDTWPVPGTASPITVECPE